MTSQQLAVALCHLASRTLPAARRQWGEAMLADLAAANEDQQALAYAGGCLRAAITERCRDFDTRFAAALWSIAIVTGLFAMIQIVCAAHGIAVLLGAPDGMLTSLQQGQGMNAETIARYEAARPLVIGCFLTLGFVQAAAGWFLVRADFKRFLWAWCAAAIVAAVAVAIQLSVIWTADGVPSEFYALLVQAAAIPALLLWSNGRHKSLELGS